MRRRELVEAIDRILKVLDDTKVIEALSRHTEKGGL